MIGENIRKHKKEVSFNLRGFDAIGAIYAARALTEGVPVGVWGLISPVAAAHKRSVGLAAL